MKRSNYRDVYEMLMGDNKDDKSHLHGPFVPYGWDKGKPLYHIDPVKNQEIYDKLGIK